MKKSLSLILAVVLAFGASATAFADHVARGQATAQPPVFAPVVAPVDGIWVLEDGEVNMVTPPAITPNSNAYYIELNTDKDMKAADIMKYRVGADWTVGKGLVEKVSIVYKKALTAAGTKYMYFVEIQPKAGIKLTKDDLQGKVTVFKSSIKTPNVASPAAIGVGTFDINFETIAEAGQKFTAIGNHTVLPISATSNKVFSFDDDISEMTITFDGVAELEINAADQDKLYLGFDRKANADIIAKHTYANLEFVNFPGKPMFYRTGLMSLYADDEATFVYEVKADGTIAAVKTTWDAEYEAHKFAVRQFAGTYIISDMELQLEAAPVAPGTETKPNPNTGR